MLLKRLPLHTRIVLALVIGTSCGLAGNLWLGGNDPSLQWVVHNITDPVGQLFLRLLLMIVVPLVFSSLIVGITGLGDVRTLGRIGVKTLAYTVVVSGLSVVIGISLTNMIEPGKRMSESTSQALLERFGSDAKTRVATNTAQSTDSPLLAAVKTVVPSNPFFAASGASPNMLHLMFFAIFFAVAMTLLPKGATTPLFSFFDGVYQVCAKCIDITMKFAPYAVACLIFNNTALFGLDLLQALMWFVLTVLLALSVQMFGVYSALVYFLSKMSPLDFLRRSKLAILTAFSTSSSSATLPTTLKVSEENLGVPKEINNFVLTVGAAASHNGTALYEGVAVLFFAQLAGLEFTLTQQIVVAYLAILGGIGTAGVPSGSIPFIVMVLASFGIDPTMIAIILGVDRILDMCRTAVNVTGDLTMATYVACSERARLKTASSPEPVLTL
jgi:DAACS family dicarboxylate/amino acid:cation (Na+ or H+) symporter